MIIADGHPMAADTERLSRVAARLRAARARLAQDGHADNEVLSELTDALAEAIAALKQQE